MTNFKMFANVSYLMFSGISFAFIIFRAPVGIMYISQFSFPVYYDSSSKAAAVNRYVLKLIYLD